jgi:hypothetical protein
MLVNPDGIIIFVEFKAPGEKPKSWQLREMKRLGNQGCHCYVIDNITAGCQLIAGVANTEAFIAELHSAADDLSELYGADAPRVPEEGGGTHH